MAAGKAAGQLAPGAAACLQQNSRPLLAVPALLARILPVRRHRAAAAAPPPGTGCTCTAPVRVSSLTLLLAAGTMVAPLKVTLPSAYCTSPPLSM